VILLVRKEGYMELQIKTDSLLKIMEEFPSRGSVSRDIVLLKALIGIMERLERLQGAILSLQRNT